MFINPNPIRIFVYNLILQDMTHKIAPSLLSADFGNLQAAIEMVNQSEADWLHLDIMDGVFVPNISFGFPVLKYVKEISTKPLDVHLMITDPIKFIKEIKEIGAYMMNVHYETCVHLHRTVEQIKENGMKAGVTLNPHTPVSLLEDIVSDVFTSLWDKIDSFDFQSDTALGYIKMCVKNSCLNYLKHQEYEWNYAEVVQKKAPIYEVEPDSVYTLDELYRMLYETLNKLPESYRTVFIKSFYEGKTHAEIAEEMNLSVKSINRYKQKTMELMRNELKDYLPLFLLLFAKI